MIFGNTSLHLANEVGTYVRRFRVNATAHAREERD